MDPIVRTFADPQFHVMCAIITSTAALYCLLAVWAATSRRHWFMRGAVVLAALAALLPIRAHEPLILLALVSVEIIALVNLWRVWKLWRGPIDHGFTWRFGVRDLLLLTVLAAGAAWIGAQCASVGLLMRLPDVLLASLLIALMALAGYMPQNHPIGWRMEMTLAVRKLLVIVPMMLGAAAIDTWLLGDWLYADNFLWLPRKHLPPLAFCILLVAYAEVGMWVLLVSSQTAELRTPDTSAFRKAAARLTLRGMAIGLTALLGWLYWQMADLTRFPPYPPMSENVYPQVVALARQQPAGDPAAEAAWLKQMLALLDRPGRIEYDPVAAALDKDYFSVNYLPVFRLHLCFEEKAEQLHASGRHDEAARIERAGLKLAGLELNGGRSVDVHRGIQFAQRAGLQIHHHRHEYSDETLAGAVTLLRTTEDGREPWQTVRQREAALVARHSRWRRALVLQVYFEMFGRSPAEISWPEVDRGQRAVMALLRIELAIERYERAYGRLPLRLRDLTPQYLDELPCDPFSGRPFVYKPSGDQFVLYSVGRDGRDDGGTFDRSRYDSQTGYDLNLETIRRP